MTNQKYKFTKETLHFNKHILHRIVATRDFGYIKKGDLGGWIENENNLSHEGNCWVSDNARVFDNAWVFGKAQVYGGAQVFGDAQVCGKAEIKSTTHLTKGDHSGEVVKAPPNKPK
jgi:hypothetical protein